MNNKKILWVSPWFGNYRIPLFDEFNKMTNGNFYVICSKENTRDLVREKLKASLGDHAIIMEGEKRSTFGNEESDFANKFLVIKKQPGLYNKIKEINPDILVVTGFGSWSPAGIRYAVAHRKKLCMVYERTFHVERNSPWYRTMYRRIVGRPVDLFLINGSLTEEYLNKGLWYKNTPKVKGCMVADSHALAEAVSKVTEEAKSAWRKELNLNNGLTFLFVGQMVDRKGIKELLAAWPKHLKTHPNDNLLVVGSGVHEQPLRELYKDVPSVHILGGIPYDKIHNYYGVCDVFIMPTLEDNWCLVIPEAMACGKPVACSIYNGGYVELVKDGVNGYNFDPLNETSIVETLDHFHGANLKKMAEEGIRIESDYWPEKAVAKMYDAMKALFN